MTRGSSLHAICGIVCTLVLAITAGCGTDSSASKDVGDGETRFQLRSGNDVEVDVPAPTSATVECVAFDGACEPLEGVTVSSASKFTCQTDLKGRCSLKAALGTGMQVLHFKKEGYLSAASNFEFVDDTPSVTQVMMVPEPADGTDLKVGDGGVVVFDNGSVTFPPNALVSGGGGELEQVSVRVHSLDVTSSDILSAPGDFTGTSATQATVLLESFGMLSVEILDGKGLPAKFVKGAGAQVELLVSDSITHPEGTVVPGWHFDDASLRWVQEGDWTVAPWSQDPSKMVYTTEVEHFSWWNIDVPMEMTCIAGKVTLCNGYPAAGAEVMAVGQDYNSVLTTFTDQGGEYCVLAKVDSVVNVSATSPDGTTVLVAAAHGIETSDEPGTCADGSCVEVDLVLPCEGEPGYDEVNMLCDL